MARHVETCKGCGGPKYVPHDEGVCITVKLAEQIVDLRTQLAAAEEDRDHWKAGAENLATKLTAAEQRAETAERERNEALALNTPAVRRAAEAILKNAEGHPDACCLHCAEGLAERDTLRAVVDQLVEACQAIATWQDRFPLIPNRTHVESGGYHAIAKVRDALAAAERVLTP